MSDQRSDSNFGDFLGWLNAQVAEGKLQLDRDRFNQIELPTYQNISLPTSIGQNTGYLPEGYVGGFGGRPTASFLGGTTDEFGFAPDDPRYAAMGIAPGTKTNAGRLTDLRGDELRGNWEHEDRRFQAERSDADRNFAESGRRYDQTYDADEAERLRQQSERDRAYALEIGADPRTVVAGQQLPDYLAAHQDFARQFAMANQGRLPTYDDLAGALGKYGLTPEDYLPAGQQGFAGQIPVAGPGIKYDPARGGYVDIATGKALDTQTAAATIRDRQGMAPQTVIGADGQPRYTLAAGVGAAGVGPGSAGGGTVQGGPALVGPSLGGGVSATGGGVRPVDDGGGMMQTQDILRRPLPAGATVGGGAAAGSATAAIGRNQPMSLDQRRLVEGGRQFDVSNATTVRQQDLQNQWTTNAQRIEEEENLRQNAIATGDLALRDRAEANLTRLAEERQGLDAEIQRGRLSLDAELGRGRLDLDKGTQTGFVDGEETLGRINTFGQDASGRNTLETGKAIGSIGGQQTLESGALLGNFNGHSTLPGQEAYGGDAYVNGGKTLAAMQALGRIGDEDTLAKQGQDADVALRTAQTVGVRSADDVFQSIARARSLENTSVPQIYDAFANPRGVPSFGSFAQTGPAPTMQRPPSAAAARPFLPGMRPAADGAELGVVNQTSRGAVIGRVQAGDAQSFMRRPAAAPTGTAGSPEDFLTPDARSTSATMGVRLARPDRIPLRNWRNMSETERGATASAYADQNPGMTRGDLEGAIAGGAPTFQRAARTRFAA